MAVVPWQTKGRRGSKGLNLFIALNWAAGDKSPQVSDSRQPQSPAHGGSSFFAEPPHLLPCSHCMSLRADMYRGGSNTG